MASKMFEQLKSDCYIFVRCKDKLLCKLQLALYLCSTQLSVKFSLLINLKLLTIAKSFLLIIAEHEIFLLIK